LEARAVSMAVEEHFSAGGVVYRVVDGDVQFVLCGRDRPAVWSLPKGTPDNGETSEETALREVREETGLQVALEGDLGQIEYWFHKPGARVHKRVQFYLMAPTGGRTEDHDPEFDRVAWFSGEDAMKTLTYPNEAAVLKRALLQVRER